MTETMPIPAVIVLPEDQILVERLWRKLLEYEERLKEYEPSELQFIQRPGSFFKRYFLQAVLENGRADLKLLVEEIIQNYPEAFIAGQDHVADAWAIIWDYCTNGGANTINGKIGGTGLAEKSDL